MKIPDQKTIDAARRPFAPEPIESATVLQCLAQHTPGVPDAAFVQLVHLAFEGRIEGLAEYLSQPEQREKRAAMRRAFRELGLLDDRNVQ